jgi:Fe2+ or Zn2+ uptake regulation protein
MTKRRVLEIFAANSKFMTPDEIRFCLRNQSQRCSVYSYLSRLCSQGLLERAGNGYQVAYRITPRGIARLQFLKNREGFAA